MAAYFLQLKPVLTKIQENIFSKSLGFVRNASKKSSSSRIGRRSHGAPTHYGFRKRHLDVVKTPGELLYHQRLLKYSPGLNVGIGPVARLYAKAPGKVLVTVEKTNYKPDDPNVQRSFPLYTPTYNRYINVIPKPMHRRFKLLEKF